MRVPYGYIFYFLVDKWWTLWLWVKVHFFLKWVVENVNDQFVLLQKYSVGWWLNCHNVSMETTDRCDGVHPYLIVLMFPKKLIVSAECAIKLGSHRLSVTEDKWGVSSLQSVPLTQPLVLPGRDCSQGNQHSSWRIHLNCALSWLEESLSNICCVNEWLSLLFAIGGFKV